MAEIMRLAMLMLGCEQQLCLARRRSVRGFVAGMLVVVQSQLPGVW